MADPSWIERKVDAALVAKMRRIVGPAMLDADVAFEASRLASRPDCLEVARAVAVAVVEELGTVCRNADVNPKCGYTTRLHIAATLEDRASSLGLTPGGGK